MSKAMVVLTTALVCYPAGVLTASFIMMKVKKIETAILDKLISIETKLK